MGNLLLYFTAVLIWGTTWLAVSYQIGTSVSPVLSVGYRFLLAALFLFIGLTIKNKKWPSIPARHHLAIGGMGVFMFSLNPVMNYLAVQYVPSGLACVAFSSFIIFNILFARLFFKAPFSIRVWMGAFCGLSGIAALFWNEISLLPGKEMAWKGLVYGIIGAMFSALGAMISTVLQKKKLPVLESSAYGMLYAGIVTVGIAWARGDLIVFDGSLKYILSLAYLSLFGSVVAFGAYLTLLGRIGPERSAYVLVATPVLALIISGVCENFRWTLSAYAGVLLVIIGNMLILNKSQK
jgi:drug/metabolite transporter (DMT)-like permease